MRAKRRYPVAVTIGFPGLSNTVVAKLKPSAADLRPWAFASSMYLAFAAV
jgi:hypothetical protein